MDIHHVILDRDGVLNREDTEGGWIRDPEEWRWEQGAREGLLLFSRAGVRISVVTNQSCIGRGVAEPEAIDRVNDHMRREAAAAGAGIDAVFVCPHAPDEGCDCRKPRSGLVRQAIEASGVPATQTVLVGDAARDLEAGRQGGVEVVLVRTGKGRKTEKEEQLETIPVYDDLHSAAIDLLGIE
ncbi:MAG: HAD-IIIA family hydrolase [Acidobacteria bacterium]|nr:MAG: HAD-IIIA family hydrolase [Acidobacteriota bacterium]